MAIYPPLNSPAPLSSKLYAYPRQQGGSESKKKNHFPDLTMELSLTEFPPISQKCCLKQNGFLSARILIFNSTLARLRSHFSTSSPHPLFLSGFMAQVSAEIIAYTNIYQIHFPDSTVELSLTEFPPILAKLPCKAK